MRARLRQLLGRFCSEDSGQDLIEYALLTVIIGLTSLVLYTTVQSTMAKNYKDSNTNIQNVWQPPPPK